MENSVKKSDKPSATKIGGMTVAGLKSDDFAPMKAKQLGDSLRKSAFKKRK